MHPCTPILLPSTRRDETPEEKELQKEIQQLRTELEAFKASFVVGLCAVQKNCTTHMQSHAR